MKVPRQTSTVSTTVSSWSALISCIFHYSLIETTRKTLAPNHQKPTPIYIWWKDEKTLVSFRCQNIFHAITQAYLSVKGLVYRQGIHRLQRAFVNLNRSAREAVLHQNDLRMMVVAYVFINYSTENWRWKPARSIYFHHTPLESYNEVEVRASSIGIHWR